MTDQQLQPREKEVMATRGETTRSGRVFIPPVDILESDDAVIVLADMPGVTDKTVAVDVDNDELTIVGELPASGSPRERVVVREYETGAFRRTFTLSDHVDRDRISATMSNGVLRLVLPKAERVKRKRIEVKAQ